MSNVVDLNQQRMDALTAGLPSKSAKMRRLAKAGYRRADIARYLGVRYQFVYNVLAAPGPDQDRGRAPTHGKAARAEPRSRPGAPDWVWVTVEKGGRLEVPAGFLEALHLQEGDEVQLALERDSIRVLTRVAALKGVQARVRQIVPDGVKLVDELIAERRGEAEADEVDGADG